MLALVEIKVRKIGFVAGKQWAEEFYHIINLAKYIIIIKKEMKLNIY